MQSEDQTGGALGLGWAEVGLGQVEEVPPFFGVDGEGVIGYCAGGGEGRGLGGAPSGGGYCGGEAQDCGRRKERLGPGRNHSGGCP